MSKKKAYSYIRFSTPEQLKGDSLRRQLESSRKYALEHNLVLDESLRDLGVSAFKGKNATEGALKRFMELIDAGQVEQGSILILESLDRLSPPAGIHCPVTVFIHSGRRCGDRHPCRWPDIIQRIASMTLVSWYSS